MLDRDKALELLENHIKNENLIKHCLAVEAQMRRLAEYFDEDKEKWGLVGLVHDLDWEETQDNPEIHTEPAAEYLEEAGANEEIIRAVRSHNHENDIEPKSLMEKALYSAEELTGFIVAVALVHPNGIDDVGVDSVMKKINDNSFAKGVDRDLISETEEMIGLSLEETVELTLEAMKSIKDKLDL